MRNQLIISPNTVRSGKTVFASSEWRNGAPWNPTEDFRRFSTLSFLRSFACRLYGIVCPPMPKKALLWKVKIFSIFTPYYHPRSKVDCGVVTEESKRKMVAFNGGIQPGIILLREGTDTSQVRRRRYILSSSSFLDFPSLFPPFRCFCPSLYLALSLWCMVTNADFLLTHFCCCFFLTSLFWFRRKTNTTTPTHATRSLTNRQTGHTSIS